MELKWHEIFTLSEKRVKVLKNSRFYKLVMYILIFRLEIEIISVELGERTKWNDYKVLNESKKSKKGEEGRFWTPGTTRMSRTI